MKTNSRQNGRKHVRRIAYLFAWVLTISAAIDFATAWHSGDIRNSHIAAAIDSAVQPCLRTAQNHIANLDRNVSIVLAHVEKTCVTP